MWGRTKGRFELGYDMGGLSHEDGDVRRKVLQERERN